MHIELAKAGIRPPLLRALGWSALFWVVALLLPVRVQASGPVWAFDILGTTTGDIAVLATAFAGLALGLLSLGERTAPTSSRALMAMTASAVGLAGLLADHDAQAALLPFLPAALSRGYVGLLLAIAAAAAGLRSPSRARALALFSVAALAALWLYLWPHPFGALSEDTLRSTRAALVPPAGLGRGAPITQAALAALPGVLVAVAALVRRFGRRDSQRVVAGWVLAAFPATLVAMGLKGAAALGADSLALVGLRAAALFCALTLALAASLEAFSAQAPSPGSLRFRAFGHAATLAALSLALAPHVEPEAPRPWTLGSAPVWAPTLYAHSLPELAIASGRREHPDGLAALREATRRALAPLGETPELRDAVADLGRYAEHPGRHRHRLESVGERLNEAARQANLPFYVDLQVVGRGRPSQGVRWMLYLKTYRIADARRFLVAGRERTSLWLSRLDGTNLVDARLGWTRHDAPEGMVILGAVRDHWREDLAPALGGATRRGRRARAYARYRASITEDLAEALAPLGRAADLAALLECKTRHDRGLAPRRTCEAIARDLEPAVLRVLAEKVETHELRHAADGARLAPPAALLSSMREYDESAVHFATAELSAYLAEVASSSVPRLALAHLLALREARPRSPEGFAGRLAERTLAEITGAGADELMSLSGAEVAAAAAEAYARLFGVAFQGPLQLDPAPLPPAAPSTPSV